MNKNLNIFIALMFLSLLVMRCKPKLLVDGEGNKLKNLSSNELKVLLKNSQFKGNWLSTKANLDVNFQGDKNSLRSNLRMRVDSATWLSLSKASIPLVTGLVSEDSVKILNKLNKGYYLNNFDKINDLLNTQIDYELLQDFFVGNPIAFDFDDDFIVKSDEGLYLLSSEKSKKIEKLLKKGKSIDEPIFYRCWVEPLNYKCSRVIVNLPTQKVKLEVNYSTWEDIGGQFFPMTASIQVSAPGDTLSMLLNYSKVEWNEPLSMPFNIPDSYQPFDFKNDSE